MIEDVEYAINRLTEALADGDTAWIEDATQEVAIAMDEQRDELCWAVQRIIKARKEGDTEWLADALEEVQCIMLALGAYTELNAETFINPPIGVTATDTEKEQEVSDRDLPAWLQNQPGIWR